MMQQRHQVAFLQDAAGGLEGVGLDVEQHLFARFHRLRMGLEVVRRMHALGGDFGHRAEAAVGDLLRHHREGLAALGREGGRGIAQHQLGDALGMGEAEGERHRAAEAVAHQHRVLGDAELIEAALDHRHVGVHQRQHGRLRAVETGQVDERDTELRSERRQHRIEGVAVGEQRMQDHQIGTRTRAHGGERAVAGGQLFELHGNDPLAALVRGFYRTRLGGAPNCGPPGTAKSTAPDAAFLPWPFVLV